MKAVATSIASRLLALALATALAGASSALAQSSRQTYDPVDIQRRLETSGNLQRQALQSLGDPTRAEQLLQKAYGELQAVQSALIIHASGQKFQDPLLDLNTRKSRQALSLLQRAADTLKTKPAGGRPYLDVVRDDLEQALRLTSTVMVF